jgi:hypothetical protein
MRSFHLTAISIGFGGGPRRSLASSSEPDNNFPNSIRNETTKSKTKKEQQTNNFIYVDT